MFLPPVWDCLHQLIHYCKGGAWLWANMGFHVSAVTYRLTTVVEKRGRDEMFPHWTSLFVQFFYSWLPTILVLHMFTAILGGPLKQRQTQTRRRRVRRK